MYTCTQRRIHDQSLVLLYFYPRPVYTVTCLAPEKCYVFTELSFLELELLHTFQVPAKVLILTSLFSKVRYTVIQQVILNCCDYILFKKEIDHVCQDLIKIYNVRLLVSFESLKQSVTRQYCLNKYITFQNQSCV